MKAYAATTPGGHKVTVIECGQPRADGLDWQLVGLMETAGEQHERWLDHERRLDHAERVDGPCELCGDAEHHGLTVCGGLALCDGCLELEVP